MDFDHLADLCRNVLGLHVPPDKLSYSQMACRTVVVLVFSILLLRLGLKRFIGHNSGYDVLLLMVLGSVLSRAINGDAAFVPTLGAALLIVMLHRLLSAAAYRWHWVSVAAKGRETRLVKDGCLDREAMRRSHITDDDLWENIRLNGRTDVLADVREAHLERSGTISVLPRDKADAGRATRSEELQA